MRGDKAVASRVWLRFGGVDGRRAERRGVPVPLARRARGRGRGFVSPAALGVSTSSVPPMPGMPTSRNQSPTDAPAPSVSGRGALGAAMAPRAIAAQSRTGSGGVFR